MSRYFAPITVDQLREKIDTAAAKHPNGRGHGLYVMRELTPTIEKDIKVSFDQENIDGGSFLGNGSNPPPMGYNTLDNGLTFLGINAGGDWEYPVYWITYWDGTKLRAYVPTEGNLWNTSTKEAYGNDELKDKNNAKKRFPAAFDADNEEDDYFDIWEVNIEADGTKIIADIKERILPK